MPPFPHIRRLGLLICSVLSAAAAPSLTVRVANTTTPSGGTAQLQVFLSAPHTLVSGELILDLDPAIFGDIVSADVFSLTGDQAGAATIQNRHLDVTFSSQTGSIGRSPGLPVLVVSVPVLAAAPVNTTSSISLKAGGAPWKDTQNFIYDVTTVPGTLTVQGSLSVKDLLPGGGALLAGTVVKIEGTGFLPGTTTAIDGVVLASTQFVSAQEIDVTLGGAADLATKRVTLTNPGGESIRFFSALRPVIVHRPDGTALSTIQPILPSQLYAAANAGGFFFSMDGVAVENPGSDPVDVLFRSSSIYLTLISVLNYSVTLPPHSIYIDSGHALGGDATDRATLNILPSAPIRAVRFSSTSATAVSPIAVPVTQIATALDGAGGLLSETGTLAVHAVAGKTVSRVLDLMQAGPPIPFTTSLSIQTGAGWLTISPSAGSTCTLILGPSLTPNYPGLTANCPDSSKIKLAFDASGLAPGTYNAMVSFVPQGYNPVPTVIPVALTVDAQPLIFADTSSISLSVYTNSGPQTSAISVTGNLDPQDFSVVVHLPGGQTWLSTGRATGSTPSTIPLAADLTGLPAGHYTASVTITGPNNSIIIPVDVTDDYPPGYNEPFFVTPTAINLTLQAGSSAVFQSFSANANYYPLTTSAQTSDGANWLTVVIHPDQHYPYVFATIDPSKLTPGVYHGTISVNSQKASQPILVPVTLAVYDKAPPITLNASSVPLTAQAGSQSAGQTVTVSTDTLSIPFSVLYSTNDHGNWLGATTTGNTSFPAITGGTTPGTVYISATAANLAPGVYTGNIVVTAPAGSANSAQIAVTLTVIPSTSGGPPPQAGTVPLVSAILNAASQTGARFTPGEIVSIFGQNLGPTTPVGFAYGPDGKVATALGGAEVRFDGKPGPLLYASATQLNAIVPYEVADTTTIEVRRGGQILASNALPISPSAPAIFTLDSSGVGAAAVLNQDNSINTPATPASRGSTIQVFTTGAGSLSPPGVTGEVTTVASPKTPSLPVTATLGGLDATVTYAAAAPSAVSGLVQINVIVPPNVTPGASVPITVKIGEAASPNGVTIAIQ